MSTHQNDILNYVDTPLRILFWTKGEILLFILPFFIGMMLDAFFFGVGVGLLNSWIVSKYKKRFGKGQLKAVQYWYLPVIKNLKCLPISYIREYLG